MWVTVVGRLTQLLLAVIMLPISGLLYFLEFLSVDNSSLDCFWSFRVSSHSSRGTYQFMTVNREAAVS